MMSHARLSFACLTQINGSVGEVSYNIMKLRQRLAPYIGTKQWKVPHFGNGSPSTVAALTDTSMKSGARVRSSSRCIEKAERQRSPLAARARPSTLGWCVGLVKSWALIGRGFQGPRVESEATRCRRDGLGHSWRKQAEAITWTSEEGYYGKACIQVADSC